MHDNERIYDGLILPHLREIDAICRRHGIAYSAVFQIGPEATSSSQLPQPGQCETMHIVMSALEHAIGEAPCQREARGEHEAASQPHGKELGH